MSMGLLSFDANNQVEFPRLILQRRDGTNYGMISNVCDLTYKDNLNEANEVSFTVYKTLDGVDNPIWNDIIDFRIIYIPEFDCRFEISVAIIDDSGVTKNVTGTALAESELSNVKLYNYEINTETDIQRVDYDAQFPTIFYRQDIDLSLYDWSNTKYADASEIVKLKVIRKSSLLHRLLENAPNYTIAHVDSHLANLKYVWEYSINDTDIYSELTGEIATDFKCLFLFDSVNRAISVYDLCNTCDNCGYRGEFNDVCPECGSTNFSGQYGNDTTILVSNENLSTEVRLETDTSSMKNCFYIEGGDDTISTTIMAINPNGSQYIYEFNEDAFADMPQKLVDRISAYNEKYDNYKNDHEFIIPQSIANDYNSVVDYYNSTFTDNDDGITNISSTLIGYPSTTDYMYQAIDFALIVKTTMMPTLDTENQGLEESMQSIIGGFASGFTDGNNVVFNNEVATNNLENVLMTTVTKTILSKR